jgi:hypothetical protein
VKYLVGGAENIGMSVCLGENPTTEVIFDAARCLSDNGHQPPFHVVTSEASVDLGFTLNLNTTKKPKAGRYER